VYFAYDGGIFEEFTVHATPEAAKADAESALDSHADGDFAAWEGGTQVCWGRIVEKAEVVSVGCDRASRALVRVAHPDDYVSYEDVIKIISAYPVTMLAGLFAEVTRLCINHDVFNKDGGMEQVVARLKAECQK
jgi:hypothetical protein